MKKGGGAPDGAWKEGIRKKMMKMIMICVVWVWV